ncbi:MAG: thiosulfate oxidation carrier protein SoxY [Burkholderiaceae bacterium]|nr:thiosulfate oxidation carrier protein SoxY [Burkholderiaceae bacterium]
MKQTRRTVLQMAGGSGLYAALVGIGMVRPGTAEAATLAELFKVKGIKGTLAAMGAGSAGESGDVVLNAPDIAENGAVVPINVTSKIPNTEMIAVLVDKNPNALAGAFEIMPGALADVSMRIKMGQSSDVAAVVKAGGKFYVAKKEIKVTLGGCGG